MCSLIREVGVDRVVFGSDYPFIAFRKVLELGLSDEDREKARFKNALGILKRG